VEPDFGAFFGPFRVPNFPVLLGFLCSEGRFFGGFWSGFLSSFLGPF
jgi:hypothetical protein